MLRYSSLCEVLIRCEAKTASQQLKLLQLKLLTSSHKTILVVDSQQLRPPRLPHNMRVFAEAGATTGDVIAYMCDSPFRQRC